ncbi:TPA: restriction endonuclease subunit S [Haemophilus influenzae]|nr:restriction endonuclease subunit S [Haemophilus influenzae]AGV12047.1 type I restriction/modification specificity protein [Haemophilus influenzae KR494]KPH72331.1 restriction endonuclease subunit S [Haemophilus influenzae]MCK8820744.1 restriction endonuclease subunit S [Haemophilus influenzae]MCK8880093.1 restriction endonuclease subunit S [Haemophilus influenzae]MDF3118997.1 restriction endonuclease subunit S [Haemophilus influenzae]
MSDWQTVTLEDITESINTGLDAIRRAPIVEHETNLRCLRIQDISQNKPFDKWGYTEVKDSDFKKFQLIPNDIIMARTCSTGICYLVKKELPAVFNNGLARIRLKIEKVDPQFIYYVFKSKHFSGYIDGISGGTSVQLNMKIGDLLKYQFNLPPLSEQKEIARILSDLDKKIELNTQINQTLEQIAQSLFKSWFVDFDPVRAKVQALSDGMSLEQAELAAMQAISGKTPEELTALSQTQPERYAELAETAKAFPCEMVEVDGVEVPKGWKQTTLSEICEMQNGYAFKSSEWTDTGIPVIKIGSIQSKILTVEGNGFVSEDNLSLRSNFVLNGGDIVIGLTGAYVGKVGRMPANKKAMLNQRVAKFLAKRINESETFYSFIYMNVIQEEFKNFVDFTAQGSAQPNISTRDILKYPLLLANNDVHLAFEKLLKKILDKSIFNSYQNEILSNSRDLLLPRLLDGENYE